MEEGREKHVKGFVAGLKEFLKALEEAEKKKDWVAGTGESGPADLRARYGYKVKVLELIKDAEQIKTKEAKSAINVSHEGSKVLVKVELPGVKEEDIDLSVSGNLLKIRAKTPEGEIKRDISIEKSKRIKKIEKAEFKNGVLIIILSKKQGEKLADRLKIWRR
ncbi:MAG: Hsp20/alpha crystallin family protein [Nanoarchaeota archaeon]